MRDKGKYPPDDVVRIDRRTPWGNPFKIGIHGDREKVIEIYRGYLKAFPQIADAARERLRGKVLACWCKPQACHGDVLAEIADSE